jgi:hypothetical protein
MLVRPYRRVNDLRTTPPLLIKRANNLFQRTIQNESAAKCQAAIALSYLLDGNRIPVHVALVLADPAIVAVALAHVRKLDNAEKSARRGASENTRS